MRLGKTQEQMAVILLVSPRAVQSYEQGWRLVPAHAERQVLFLLALKSRSNEDGQKPCWIVKECPAERREICPAWELNAGKFCWFINGTMCEGIVQKDWQQKMQICRSCEVMNFME